MKYRSGLVIVAIALSVGGCSSSADRCTESFDAEVIPSAEGYPSRVAAVEAWAADGPAPDSGWTETSTGATAGDWVVTTVQTADGGWLVESMRCAVG